MNVVDSVKDIIVSLNEDPETEAKLQMLRKEIAREYVKKLKKEKPDILITVAEDKVLDYLIDDWFTDQFHDAAVGKMIDVMSWFSGELKEFREKLNSASTEDELIVLKSQIGVGEEPKENQWSSVTEENQWSSVTEENQWSSVIEENQWSSVIEENQWSSVIEENQNIDNGDGMEEAKELSQSSQFNTFNHLDSWLVVSREKKENLWRVEGFDVAKIHSAPARKNPKTWVTLCAATAKFNAQKFGLTFPSGNAWDASTSKPIEQEYRASLPISKKEERPNWNWKPLSIADFDAMKDVNVADIYPDSKSKYGHRAVAFRDQTGEWMVLDPYIKVPWTDATEPKKLEDYMKIRKVFKGHFYAV